MRSLVPGFNAPIDYLMILRGCAVLGVFCSHYLGIGALTLGGLATRGSGGYEEHDAYLGMWRSALEVLTPLIGSNFVTLFFVLSGYLMGKVFFDGRYDAASQKGAFYWARYLRLAPALYVNVLFATLFFHAGDRHDLVRKLVSDLLFISNFTGPTLNRVTWSLAHEMQYYLVAPFVFLAFRRRPGLLVLTILVVVFANPFPQFGFFFSFLLGFGINHLPKKVTTQRTKNLMLVLGLVGLHLVYNAFWFARLYGEAHLAAAAFSVFLVWNCDRPAAAQSTKPLQWLMMTGYLTYGFYLWHYMVLYTFYGRITDLSLSLSSSVAIASLIYHFLALVVALPLSYFLAWMSFAFIETAFRPGLYQRR